MEELKKELLEIANKNNNKISCAKAWEMAEKYSISKKQIGDLLNDLNIKITGCQLGCF